MCSMFCPEAVDGILEYQLVFCLKLITATMNCGLICVLAWCLFTCGASHEGYQVELPNSKEGPFEGVTDYCD